MAHPIRSEPIRSFLYRPACRILSATSLMRCWKYSKSMHRPVASSTSLQSNDIPKAHSCGHYSFNFTGVMSYPDLLFVPYQDSLDLLSVDDAMRICEDVYRMLARGTVDHCRPPSFKLDVAEDFNNHWHVKAALLREIPTTGVRLYNYFDDGKRNTVGLLECGRYIVLCDPKTGHGLAFVEQNRTYGIRSAAAATIACKWLAPARPRVLGLVGVGSMGANALRCLSRLYRFDEIRCTSRRRQTREAFAARWSAELGIAVRPCDTVEEVVRGADIAVGGTNSSEIMTRERWLKPGSVFIYIGGRER